MRGRFVAHGLRGDAPHFRYIKCDAQFLLDAYRTPCPLPAFHRPVRHLDQRRRNA